MLKQAAVDARDAKDAGGDAAAMAMELGAVKQRESMAWNHSADLVQVITKLNDALRMEKESHGADQQRSSELAEELGRAREAAERDAQRAAEETAALRRQ